MMNSIREIIKAKPIKQYTIQITFSDLQMGIVDLKKYLGKGVFKELADVRKFRRFKVDRELGTIVWPNGADIAPEVLYQEAVVNTRSGRVPDAA
jgi:hypothetical protein